MSRKARAAPRRTGQERCQAKLRQCCISPGPVWGTRCGQWCPVVTLRVVDGQQPGAQAVCARGEEQGKVGGRRVAVTQGTGCVNALAVLIRRLECLKAPTPMSCCFVQGQQETQTPVQRELQRWTLHLRD